MNRQVQQIISGIPATDGAGVELVRVIGQPKLNYFDPFILLDTFRTNQAKDYIAGFPPHPHRGFETVTYMLNGAMRHKDNQGNEGVISPGGVQWMTAGKGIIHSEMPEQEEGLLEGFQLWVNLPASHKMQTPAYQEYDASQIKSEQRDGALIKVISGETSHGTQGIVKQPLTEPYYFHVSLDNNSQYDEALPEGHNAMLYVVEGQVSVDDDVIQKDQLALLTTGDNVSIKAKTDSQFLLIAGKPLNESIARGGPFVMNTKQEIQQAFEDYQSGQF